MSRKSKQSLTVIAAILVGAALGGLLPSVLEAVGGPAGKGGESPARITNLSAIAEKRAGDHFLVIDKRGRDALFQPATGEELAKLETAADTARFVVEYQAAFFCLGLHCVPCRVAVCPIPPPPLPFSRMEAQIAAGWRLGETPKELAGMR